MSHYYIVASLPLLKLGETPPVSREYFLAACAVLPEEEQREVALVAAGRCAEGHSDFCRQWLPKETQLRNAVARQRGARRGVEAAPFLRDHTGFDVSVEKEVQDAFARPDALERELALDRCRWRLLDELAQPAPFSLAAVLAFAVKLQLAWRWAELKDEEGRARLDRLVAANIQRDPALRRAAEQI